MLSIAEIGGAEATAQSANTVKKEDTLGQDAFLKIFLAQLQHQDPLNPMEGTEFTAQLAQFSSLEQLFNVNQHLKGIETAQDGNLQFQALSLIGKEIMAKGDELSLGAGPWATAGFSLAEGSDCTVLITDGTGQTVRTLSLGWTEAGQHTFQWDGRDDRGSEQAPGIYRFEVIATDASGQSQTVTSMIAGEVTRVNLQGGSPVIYVGGTPVSMSQIVDVRVPEKDQAASEEDPAVDPAAEISL
jgi:flagellar basal-body rod modification protein FlgD